MPDSPLLDEPSSPRSHGAQPAKRGQRPRPRGPPDERPSKRRRLAPDTEPDALAGGRWWAGDCVATVLTTAPQAGPGGCGLLHAVVWYLEDRAEAVRAFWALGEAFVAHAEFLVELQGWLPCLGPRYLYRLRLECTETPSLAPWADNVRQLRIAEVLEICEPRWLGDMGHGSDGGMGCAALFLFYAPATHRLRSGEEGLRRERREPGRVTRVCGFRADEALEAPPAAETWGQVAWQVGRSPEAVRESWLRLWSVAGDAFAALDQGLTALDVLVTKLSEALFVALNKTERQGPAAFWLLCRSWAKHGFGLHGIKNGRTSQNDAWRCRALALLLLANSRLLPAAPLGPTARLHAARAWGDSLGARGLRPHRMAWPQARALLHQELEARAAQPLPAVRGGLALKDPQPLRNGTEHPTAEAARLLVAQLFGGAPLCPPHLLPLVAGLWNLGPLEATSGPWLDAACPRPGSAERLRRILLDDVAVPPPTPNDAAAATTQPCGEARDERAGGGSPAAWDTELSVDDLFGGAPAPPPALVVATARPPEEAAAGGPERPPLHPFVAVLVGRHGMLMRGTAVLEHPWLPLPRARRALRALVQAWAVALPALCWQQARDADSDRWARDAEVLSPAQQDTVLRQWGQAAAAVLEQVEATGRATTEGLWCRLTAHHPPAVERAKAHIDEALSRALGRAETADALGLVAGVYGFLRSALPLAAPVAVGGLWLGIQGDGHADGEEGGGGPGVSGAGLVQHSDGWRAPGSRPAGSAPRGYLAQAQAALCPAGRRLHGLVDSDAWQPPADQECLDWWAGRTLWAPVLAGWGRLLSALQTVHNSPGGSVPGALWAGLCRDMGHPAWRADAAGLVWLPVGRDCVSPSPVAGQIDSADEGERLLARLCRRAARDSMAVCHLVCHPWLHHRVAGTDPSAPVWRLGQAAPAQDPPPRPGVLLVWGAPYAAASAVVSAVEQAVVRRAAALVVFVLGQAGASQGPLPRPDSLLALRLWAQLSADSLPADSDSALVAPAVRPAPQVRLDMRALPLSPLLPPAHSPAASGQQALVAFGPQLALMAQALAYGLGRCHGRHGRVFLDRPASQAWGHLLSQATQAAGQDAEQAARHTAVLAVSCLGGAPVLALGDEAPETALVARAVRAVAARHTPEPCGDAPAYAPPLLGPHGAWFEPDPRPPSEHVAPGWPVLHSDGGSDDPGHSRSAPDPEACVVLGDSQAQAEACASLNPRAWAWWEAHLRAAAHQSTGTGVAVRQRKDTVPHTAWVAQALAGSLPAPDADLLADACRPVLSPPHAPGRRPPPPPALADCGLLWAGLVPPPAPEPAPDPWALPDEHLPTTTAIDTAAQTAPTFAVVVPPPGSASMLAGVPPDDPAGDTATSVPPSPASQGASMPPLLGGGGGSQGSFMSAGSQGSLRQTGSSASMPFSLSQDSAGSQASSAPPRAACSSLSDSQRAQALLVADCLSWAPHVPVPPAPVWCVHVSRHGSRGELLRMASAALAASQVGFVLSGHWPRLFGIEPGPSSPHPSQ